MKVTLTLQVLGTDALDMLLKMHEHGGRVAVVQTMQAEWGGWFPHDVQAAIQDVSWSSEPAATVSA